MRFHIISGLLLCLFGGWNLVTLTASSLSSKPELKFTVTTPCTNSITVFQDQSIIGPRSIIRRSWAFGDGTAPVLGNLVEHRFRKSGTYLVTLSLTEKGGQTHRLSQEIDVNDPPLSPIPYSAQVCYGGTISLEARTDRAGEQNIYWYQEAGSSTPFFVGPSLTLPNLQSSVDFYIASTQPNGCESKRILISAEVLPSNQVRLLAIPDAPVLPVAEVTFGVESLRPIRQWQWDFGDGSLDFSPSPLHEYRSPGDFEVSVTIVDENGCTETLRQLLTVTKNSGVEIPSAFSPNGDEVNDLFTIEYYNLSNFQIEIFDRNGKRIFYTEDPDFRWDGRDQNGKILAEGEYGLVVQAVDTEGKKIAEKRTIVLIR